MLKKALIAGGIASFINLIIGTLAAFLTNAPQEFGPFMTAPILTGCFGGALLATIVFSFTSRTVFVCLAVFTLLASYNLPYRIAFSSAPRFEGLTLAMQLTLGLMHTITAMVIIFIFLKKERHAT